MNKIKAHALPKSLKIKIGVYKRQHPGNTIAAIAEYFKVTPSQAYVANRQYKQGKLTVSRKVKPKKVDEVISEMTPDEIIPSQYHACLAALEADKDIPVGERVKLLDMLVGIRKVNQQISIQNHLKKADAGIVSAIIRRYVPEASDDDIIKIIQEEAELWKMNSQK